MSALRLYTDEDMHGALAGQLRAAGWDAVSTPEANRLGERDPAQLTWAAQNSRVLVTFNVADFARLHHDWMQQGLHHAGLIVSRQRPVGETLRGLLRLAQTLSAEEMQDRLEYLSDWPPICAAPHLPRRQDLPSSSDASTGKAAWFMASLPHASTPLMTCPWTSVRRRSLPLWRKVSFSWSIPSRCSTVACRS